MLLGAMFALLGETNKPTIHFFSEMFETLFSMRGRVHFTNLSRYSGYNESTFRRRFGQHFDWLSLNSMLIDFAVGVPNAQIAAVDCSFIKKSGSATFGLDRYWSGCAGQAEKGLEISALAVIDVSSEQAWMLDVVQTPAHLRVKDALETPEGAVALEGTPPRSKKAIAAALQEAKRLQALEQTAKAAAQAQARIEKEVLKKQLKIEKEASKVRQAAQKAQWRTEIHQMEDAPSKKAAKQMHKEVEKAQKAAEKVQKATEKAQKAAEKAQKAAQKAQKKEGENRYSRIDFYIEQILDCLLKLTTIPYIVADGFYAKTKFIHAIVGMGKHLITKLRPDANLRFDFRGEHPKKQGPKAQYAGKAVYDDLSQWDFEGTDAKYDYLSIYSRICWSPQFECWLRVVIVVNHAKNRYILLASTDLKQSALEIVTFYQLRFQIEFLFRDAKQFTGLNHCQARDDAKLDFHFNMSLTAINLIQALQIKDPTVQSINDWSRKMYNTKIVQNLLEELSLTAELDLSNPSIQKVINLGAMYSNRIITK
jgi:hypothetical protein